MKKVYPDAKLALDGILKDGMMIMSGGFGLCGIAETLSGFRACWRRGRSGR
jgi:3-oxoacid CoA-transferase subunit A